MGLFIPTFLKIANLLCAISAMVCTTSISANPDGVVIERLLPFFIVYLIVFLFNLFYIFHKTD